MKKVLLLALMFALPAAPAAQARALVSPGLTTKLCDAMRKELKKTLPYCENGNFALIRDGKGEDEYGGPNVVYLVESDDTPRIQTICYFDLVGLKYTRGQIDGAIEATDCKRFPLPLED